MRNRLDVKIYVEGGAVDNDFVRTQCRKGFQKFVESAARKTQPYKKGPLSFRLLASSNPDIVAESCPHAKEFLVRLKRHANFRLKS